MKQFSALVNILGTSTKTNDKLSALSEYFANANDKDKVWVIALFSGRRPKRAVNSTKLQDWCIELSDLPPWLFEESYHTVGDLAETIALLLSENISLQHANPLHYYLEKLIGIEKQDEQIKKKFIRDCWMEMNKEEIFVFNKLITGGFRIGVSQQTMVNALAKATNLSSSVIAHRISGNWDPVSTSFEELMGENVFSIDMSKPYPFYLAYALDDELNSLGEPNQWQAEWKWDGIRGQIIKRNNELFVWSRGEELMTEKFPEYHPLRNLLPDGIAIDGEIIALAEKRSDNIDFMPMPFAALQTRIGRKNISKKQLTEAPISFIAYDLLEINNEDCRERTMSERRTVLEKIVKQINHPVLRISPVIEFEAWDDLPGIRERSRDVGSEGIMLKRKNSIYLVGRKRGDWWKWKIDPLVIDAVMVYAQKGHGRRSNLYTDYTFAVRDGEKLTTFTKAYSGLTDEEFAQVDNFVKRNSIEKFGPVRTVKPELVFEIAFEGIAASTRHKSGVALRFPRINRWRKDKKAAEINTLDDLKKMLEMYAKT
jgi:ATP-dependent DNA ligase